MIVACAPQFQEPHLFRKACTLFTALSLAKPPVLRLLIIFSLSSNEATTSIMAATSVFGTCELLEGILLQLEFKDIMNTRAVSKEWKAAIEASLPLKRKLFLVADSSERITFDRHDPADLAEGDLILGCSPYPHRCRAIPFDILPAFTLHLEIPPTGTNGGHGSSRAIGTPRNACFGSSDGISSTSRKREDRRLSGDTYS